MQLFKCTQCGNPVYFENVFCGNCGASLGFLADKLKTIAFTQADGYQYCANYQFEVCNWLVPADGSQPFCKACELNRTIPPIAQIELRQQWKKIEIAKHRLIYSLLRLKLPVISKTVDPEKGLAFDLLSEQFTPDGEKVLTGHLNGLITLNVVEADEIEREMAKRNLQEVYRTLLGHFRHEIAHYYWDFLISNSDQLFPFKNVFGDEQLDYKLAMENYYNNGTPANWSDQYISAYASMHPWEDWAETWAHYMHITDTLETAYSFGLSLDPIVTRKSHELSTEVSKDPFRMQDFNELFETWLPLTFAMNSLNRSMGLQDIYPFVISKVVKEKLSFIHQLILRTSTETSSR